MKVKKKNRLLLVTNLLAITALVLASIPVSAQTGAEGTPTPPPLTRLAADSSVYLPFIVRPASPDLVVGAFETTQAVQNLNNTVPLVAGKPTVLRVYVQTNFDTRSGVYVSLSATRNGTPLTGSPMTRGPLTITPSWLRGNLSNSFNFTLPPTWLSGSVTLQIRVDPNNAIIEGSESNNLTTTVANFIEVPTLDVKVVPIEYEDFYIYPPASSDYLEPGLLRMFPIGSARVTRRAYITWSQTLAISNSWSNLLSRIATIKQTDNAPEAQIYYGLVPLRAENGSIWFRSGVAGIGYVGYRASAGLANLSPYINGSEIANHEFGHNLGQEHANCGVSNPDPSYPYEAGSIGQFGLQVNNMLLFNPTTYKDIMSYCDPAWISDYTYQALFDDQVAAGAASPNDQSVVPSLLVRASLLEDGTVEMEPVYTFNGRPGASPSESDYVLELLDESGSVIASYRLPVLTAEGESIKFSSINTTVPLPDKPFAALRITDKGRPAVQRSMAPASLQTQAMPTLEVETQGAVLSWGQASTPAVVRYQLDGDETWTTLAVDHLGGSLELDEQSLPLGMLRFEIILADQTGSTLTLDWENSR